jgi:hypothetical protein
MKSKGSDVLNGEDGNWKVEGQGYAGAWMCRLRASRNGGLQPRAEVEVEDP